MLEKYTMQKPAKENKYTDIRQDGLKHKKH